MSTFDLSQVAISHTFSGNKTNNSDYYKNGYAFGNKSYYGSKTTFTLDTTGNLRILSDGDPYPSRCGTNANYTNDKNSKRLFGTLSLVEQYYDVTFKYLGGKGFTSSDTIDGSNNAYEMEAVGILTNGAKIGGQSAGYGSRGYPFSYSATNTGGYKLQYYISTTDLTTTDACNNNVKHLINAAITDYVTGIDDAGGHISPGGFVDSTGNQAQYHIHDADFTKTNTLSWSNDTLKDSNNYIKNTNYNGDYLRNTNGHSKILGMCFDGYPIYGPYGYNVYNNSSSSVVNMKTGYKLRSTEFTGRPYKYTDTFKYNNGKSTEIAIAGTYIDDYEYDSTITNNDISNNGYLDYHNGRYCITPEYPNGTYAYFMTIDSSKNSVFPYVIGLTTKNTLKRPNIDVAKYTTNVTNSPIEGATVFYVDSQGNMLPNSPTAITDKYGDFSMIFDENLSDTDIEYFQEQPLKITGGSNTLTGQSISYWYANAGTSTMTPITNLLFYCSAPNSLSNDDILNSLDYYHKDGTDKIYFSNYNYYKTLINTTDTTTDTYLDALKSNNLGNSINIFATIGAYFLYGVNGTNIDTEYDAMMRSIANISINNGGRNEFAELFGTVDALCASVIKDRLKNKITNYDLSNNYYNGTKYTELFADALSQQMSNIITTVMKSTDIGTTDNYELIGYAVVQNVYKLSSIVKQAVANSSNDKQAILSYFTKNVEAIFKEAISNQLFDYEDHETYQGKSPIQTINNTKSSEQVMMRKHIVKSWNNEYATGFVNGAKRIVTPFRAVNNSGDFLARQNYICGGPNQVNASKPGWKSHIGSILSKCDFSGIPSSTCNVKYVPDASDYIKYKKLRANNHNYNDRSNGGYTNSSYVDLMRVRR